MSLDLSFEDQQLLAETIQRSQSSMTTRERLAETLVGAAAGVAVLALWLIAPPGAIEPVASAGGSPRDCCADGAANGRRSSPAAASPILGASRVRPAQSERKSRDGDGEGGRGACPP